MVTLHMRFNNKHVHDKPVRTASRCILIKDNKILMSYETLTDKWMIPGGGVEENESLSDCCAREMAEETGVIVVPKEKFLTIVEYFDDINYVNNYFVAEYVRETDRSPTENELLNGMQPSWICIDEIINIFSKHEELETIDPMRSGLYRREHTALSYFRTLYIQKNKNY